MPPARTRLGVAAVALACLAAGPARADDLVRLVLENHRFQPDEVTVTAGRRFRVEVTNKDATPAEFESTDLRVEKIVVPGGTVVVGAGPLRPGRYRFFDEYNPDQAKGTLVAVEQGTGE